MPENAGCRSSTKAWAATCRISAWGASSKKRLSVASLPTWTRAAGKKSSIPEAVKMVQPLFSKREEGLLKATPLDRLRKIRPDVVEAVKKELLEEVKQKREEETLKKPLTSSPPDQKEQVSHRVPTSRW